MVRQWQPIKRQLEWVPGPGGGGLRGPGLRVAAAHLSTWTCPSPEGGGLPQGDTEAAPLWLQQRGGADSPTAQHL